MHKAHRDVEHRSPTLSISFAFLRRIYRNPWLFGAAMLPLIVSLSASCSDDPSISTSPSGTGTGTGGAGGAGGSGGAGAGTQAWVMGDPISMAKPTFMEASHPLPPSTYWGSLSKPHPTNAAWMDLVLGTGDNAVNILPYTIKSLANGLQVSLPARVVDPKFVLSTFSHDISFETIEQLTKRAIIGHDLLSVSMQWSSVGGGTMTAPLVRGMPYVTAIYDQLAPRIESAHSILSVNDGAPSPVTGDRFSIAMNNGQTWVLYSSAPITFNWSASGMSSSAPFSGHLRAAVIGEATGAAEALDTHRSAVPTGGDVAITVEGDTASIQFNWKKQGEGPLLMAALPHHMDTLVTPNTTPVEYATIRGKMKGVSGDSWSISEPLSPITWTAPAGIDPAKVADIKSALADDAAFEPAAKDPYSFGKQVAKLGRLALIADELGEKDTANSIRTKMRTFFDPWLTGKNADPLLYESTWGGIVSKDGLAMSGADFGQGWYNDHHFHYGYHIYAAAAIAKADPDWLATHKAAVVDLVRDIANPSPKDPWFTPFRNKDWFEGHSWAAGLFPLVDGRNQESTSEAVNAWYGVHLFGLVTGDANITNIGRVLLATEIRSTQKYWQINQDEGIYEEPFAANKVAGILWGSKVDYSTFFGSSPELIHCIQMIPFTPITETLLQKSWVSEEYPVLAPALNGAIGEGWKGFVYMDHAVIDPVEAWNEVQKLTDYDDGNSKTNTLYWVATRPK